MGDRTEFLSDQILKWLLYKLLVNYEVNDEIEGNFGGAHARIRGTLGVYHMQDCTFSAWCTYSCNCIVLAWFQVITLHVVGLRTLLLCDCDEANLSIHP